MLPVLILVGISLFSFRLLFAYHDMPTPDLTVKATGNQWNWAYEYPDQGVAEYISNMLPEDEVAGRGNVPYRLAADEPIVVPVGKTVRVLVTAADVIHAFALPAFGLKTDAIPGRVNETWFKRRPHRHLLRPVLGTVRRRPRLHADPDQCRDRRPSSRPGSRPRVAR